MSFQHVQVERDGPVTRITIDRPEVMNALHPPAQHELDRVFNDFQDDPEQWVAVITGAGERAFSAGNDLKYQAEHGMARVREQNRGLRGGFGGLTSRFDCFKPIVAAVNGFALGGGFEIVLACDIVLAAETATFGLPEPRVGLLAGAGGVHRLPRAIPYHQAMGMLLTGRHITAREAQQMGIVNEVVEPGELPEAARRWVAQILECAPLSVRASKEAALRGAALPLRDAMQATFTGHLAMLQSEDVVEGPRAFAEKRKPTWKGR